MEKINPGDPSNQLHDWWAIAFDPEGCAAPSIECTSTPLPPLADRSKKQLALLDAQADHALRLNGEGILSQAEVCAQTELTPAMPKGARWAASVAQIQTTRVTGCVRFRTNSSLKPPRRFVRANFFYVPIYSVAEGDIPEPCDGFSLNDALFVIDLLSELCQQRTTLGLTDDLANILPGR